MIPYQDDKMERAEDYKQALVLATEQFDFDMVPLYRKDFKISPEGKFNIQSQTYPISRGGIQNLCSMLKIPDPFANRIPTDLFIKNVNRLLDEKPDNRVNAYFRKDDTTIIDINERVNFQNIPTHKLISSLPEDGMHRVMFENHMVKAEAFSDEGLDIEVEGEKHRTGHVIFHYPTARQVPQGYISLWTLICSNGAMAPRAFMREKLNIKSSSDQDILLSKFIERITKISVSKELLEERFKLMHEQHLFNNDLQKLYQSVKRAVGKEDAVLVLGDSVVEEYAALKEEPEDIVTTIKYYTIYYNLTYYASNVTKSAKLSRKFQSQAGKLLFTDEI